MQDLGGIVISQGTRKEKKKKVKDSLVVQWLLGLYLRSLMLCSTTKLKKLKIKKRLTELMITHTYCLSHGILRIQFLLLGHNLQVLSGLPWSENI